MWVVGDSPQNLLPTRLRYTYQFFSFLGFSHHQKNFIYLCQNKHTPLLLLFLLLSPNNDYLYTTKLAPIIPHHPPLAVHVSLPNKYE
jgi:hypothetical protein